MRGTACPGPSHLFECVAQQGLNSGPGISVCIASSSRATRACLCGQSSYSLGRRCFLFFHPTRCLSWNVRRLIFQQAGDPPAKLGCHRRNRLAWSHGQGMALINAIIKLSELGILADGCPSRLNELGAEAPIAYPGDGALVDPVAGGILTRNQTEKGRQLSDIVNERSIADTCQQMRGRNAANAEIGRASCRERV